MTPPRRGRPTITYRHDSIAAVIASQGLYLAVIFGLIMILAIGSILAVQLRPYAAPPGKTLTGHSNQPRLVNIVDSPGSIVSMREGGECYGQDA